MPARETHTQKNGLGERWHALPHEHRIAILSCTAFLLLGVLLGLSLADASSSSDMSVGFVVTDGTSSSSSSSSSTSATESSSSAADAERVETGGNSRRAEEILETLTQDSVPFILEHRLLPVCNTAFAEKFGLRREDSAILCEVDEVIIHKAAGSMTNPVDSPQSIEKPMSASSSSARTILSETSLGTRSECSWWRMDWSPLAPESEACATSFAYVPQPTAETDLSFVFIVIALLLGFCIGVIVTRYFMVTKEDLHNF